MKLRAVSLLCLSLVMAVPFGRAQHPYRQLYEFGFVPVAATEPSSPLVEGPEGWLYGTSAGANGGVIYRVKKDGSAISIVFDFGEVGGSPSGGPLIVGTDGALYGTMLSFAGGEVYRIQPNGTGFQSYLVVLGLQTITGVIEGTDGRLYGATSAGGANEAGTLFAINKDGGDFATLHEFAGSPSEGLAPAGEPLEAGDGWLYLVTSYGGAENGGTICRISKTGSGLSVLHHFPALGTNDGRVPSGRLAEGPGGYLYGTTTYGGLGGEEEFFTGLGVVYRMSTNGADYSLVRRFEGTFNDGERPRNILAGSDGQLYGTTQNAGYARNVDAIFRMDTSGENFSLVYTWVTADHQTIRLNGFIESADGNFYGTSAGGGANGWGQAFKVRPNGTQYQGLHDFAALEGDGTPPHALVVDTDGALYGSTLGGGANGSGTLYKIETNGSYVVLHEFASSGGFPLGLVAASDGLLYGSSYLGRHVFQINKDGSGYAVLTNVSGAPLGPLIEGTDFLLYGVTEDGGAQNAGSVFRLNADGTDLRQIHSFTNTFSSVVVPFGILEGSDGKLYGATIRGGTNNQGMVYRLEKDGSQFQVLHNFVAPGGANVAPNPLREASDGYLYGTTYRGGGNGQGTIYRMTKSGGYELIHAFAAGQGNPVGQLAEGPGSWLYGVTQQSGDFGGGYLFRFKTGGSSAIYVLHHFGEGKLGRDPGAGVVVGPGGEIYGTTQSGGFGNGFGTVFRLDVKPILAIRLTGSELELSWPWNGDRYALQATDNLRTPFMFLSQGATNGAGRFIATEPLGTGARFYRLEQVLSPPGGGQ